MNQETFDHTNQANGTFRTNRRRFLQVAGFTGLAGLTATTSSRTANTSRITDGTEQTTAPSPLGGFPTEPVA